MFLWVYTVYKYWVHEGCIEESLSVVGSCQDALSPDILHVSQLSPSSILCSSPTVGVTSEKGLFIAGLWGWHRSRWKKLLRRTASKTFSFFFYVVFTLVFIYLLLKIIFGTWLNPGLITCSVNVSSLSYIPGLFLFSLLAASLVWTAPSCWWQCSWDELAKPIHKCSF